MPRRHRLLLYSPVHFRPFRFRVRKKTLSPTTRRLRAVSPHAALLAALCCAPLSRSAHAQGRVAAPATREDTSVMPAAPGNNQTTTQTAPQTASPQDKAPAAQDKTPAAPPSPGSPAALAPTAPPAPGDKQTTPTPPQEATPNAAPPGLPNLAITGPYNYNIITGDVAFTGRSSIEYQGIIIAADRVAGNANTELVASGNARIQANGVTTNADVIHFYPRQRRYRLDNARSVLSPDILQNRVYDNVYTTARDVVGDRTGFTRAEGTTETTCIEPFHHYELRSRDALLFPGKRLVLHQTSVYLFGAKLITLPYLVIPLDQKPRKSVRPDYFPEFGQNYDEGYYARFPYEFPEGQDAATYLQLSLTQRKGERIRVEQEYLAGKQGSDFNTGGAGFGPTLGGIGGDAGGSLNSAFGYGQVGPRLPRLGVGLGPNSGGLFTIQGYTGSGFSRDFTTSFRHQQGIGGDNRIGFSEELTKQSYLVSTGQTTQNTRFDFAHDDAAHGVNALASLNLQTTDSPLYTTSQLTGSLRNAYTFAAQGTNRNSLSYQFDLSHLLNTNTTPGTADIPTVTTVNRTARLDSQFQFQHTSREYAFTFNANKDTALGFQSAGSNFGTLEKLPEFQLTADTQNFKGGTLHRLPTQFLLDLGRYNEPINQVNTERLLASINVPQITLLRGRTELVTGAGFEQRLYGDGAAQYITRDNTRLRQHLLGRSGVDFNYTYEQPEGGTPFQFDAFNKSHYITAEGGYLDDKHFQATFRSGYDLTGRSAGMPWQTVTARLMYSPSRAVRFDQLTTYDPNVGKFRALTNQVRLRGRNDFALDIVNRIDPQQPGIRRKFSQINTQFDIPFKGGWRLAALLRYNGVTGNFDSRAAELKHEWDCLEASFSYSETPNGFRNDRQFNFALRIKGLPSTRRFNRGPAGEALGIGVGDIY